MRGFEKPVADLIRGTAIEDDEVEVALLRKLPLEEQLEVGLVLHEAMLQEKRPNGVRNERLVGVRSVADARRFLDQSRGSPYRIPWLSSPSSPARTMPARTSS